MKEKFENRYSLQYAVKPKTDYNKELIESIKMTPACQKAFEELSKGDESPFQFLQELKFGEKNPASDGTIFTKEWAESYLKVLEKAPIPGSKDGHTAESSWKERVSNEVYVIAGKVENDDTMILRHYITKDMPEYEYNKLIKEMKAGLLSTSIMSYAKMRIEIDEKEENLVWYAMESLGGERNDIVEWNQTGMVSGVVATSQKAENIEEKSMDEEFTIENAIEKINNYCKELGGDRKVIAQKLGLGELLTDDVAQKAKMFDELESKMGGIEKFYNETIESQKSNFNAIKEIELQKAFKDNRVAIDVVSDMIGDVPVSQKELTEKIESFKNLKSVQSLVGEKSNLRNMVLGNQTESKGTLEFTV